MRSGLGPCRDPPVADSSPATRGGGRGRGGRGGRKGEGRKRGGWEYLIYTISQSLMMLLRSECPFAYISGN